MMTRACEGSISLIAMGLVALWGGSQAFAANPDAVGIFTTVQGKVLMTHSGTPAAVSVNQSDDVFFRAVIETQRASRTKALFQDDTLLTVGENSRVEITEQIYDPNRDLRSVVANLVTGKVRALVGRLFEGAGSKFEIHTPTAVAAARGTYFVVWVDEKKPTRVGQSDAAAAVRPVSLMEGSLAQAQGVTSGAANIGQAGTVTFTSGGQSVNLLPGQFSVALPNLPPSPPVFIVPTASGAQGAISAINNTEIKEAAKPESPKEVLQVTGSNAPIAAPPSVQAIGQPTVAPAPVGQAPPVPVTPPAVVSGVVETTSRVTLSIKLP